MSRLNVEKVPSTEDKSLPIFAEVEQLATRIRDRAYSLFAGRGFSGGSDFDDWLMAEQEICWPKAELVEDDKVFVVKVALAGFDPKDLAVTATPREIIVKATHEYERKEPDDSETKIRWSEFRSEDVYRRIGLPADIDVDKVDARFQRGLLVVAAPKAPASRPKRKVTISTAA